MNVDEFLALPLDKRRLICFAPRRFASVTFTGMAGRVQDSPRYDPNFILLKEDGTPWDRYRSDPILAMSEIDPVRKVMSVVKRQAQEQSVLVDLSGLHAYVVDTECAKLFIDGEPDQTALYLGPLDAEGQYQPVPNKENFVPNFTLAAIIKQIRGLDAKTIKVRSMMTTSERKGFELAAEILGIKVPLAAFKLDMNVDERHNIEFEAEYDPIGQYDDEVLCWSTANQPVTMFLQQRMHDGIKRFRFKLLTERTVDVTGQLKLTVLIEAIPALFGLEGAWKTAHRDETEIECEFYPWRKEELSNR